MKKFRAIRLFAVFICLLILCLAAAGCGVIGGDKTSGNPDYHPSQGGQDEADSGDGNGGSQELYGFTLNLRKQGSGSVTEENGGFEHSATDGELIASWEIPYYGNTVYESVVKYFSQEGAEGMISFRLSQHRFYMFHEAATPQGDVYDLETAYVDADGKYSMCANFEEVLGADGVAATDDDLKVVTIVYRGWFYRQ